MRVVLSGKGVSAVLKGRCEKCGECCRTMCKAPFMLNDEGICLFLCEDNLCGIHARRWIPTDRQYAYWKANCETFPAILEKQDARLVLRSISEIGFPFKSCGYKLEVRDIG